MLFDILLAVVGVIIGWHFPQPLWAKAAWAAITAWIQKIRDR